MTAADQSPVGLFGQDFALGLLNPSPEKVDKYLFDYAAQ